jgi:hypothetical protein
MGAQLAATVYVKDPETHQTVRLEPGTLPEPRLASLVTNPAAWVDGKLPRLPKKQEQSDGQQDPTGDGPGGASGDASDSAAGNDQAAPAATKTAAKKTATSRSRGRNAAGEGTSGD